MGGPWVKLVPTQRKIKFSLAGQVRASPSSRRLAPSASEGRTGTKCSSGWELSFQPEKGPKKGWKTTFGGYAS